MKKIILSIAYILVASSFLFAQEEQSQHELTINLGGGLSTLGLQTESSKLGLDGPLMPKLGGSLGLGYTYHINNQFGIGTGIEANFYRSEYSNDNLIGNYRDVDPLNLENPAEYFQLNYTYNEKYKEIQNAIFVQIPLMLQFQTGDYHKFYVAVGGRVGIPVYTKFNTDASALTTTGFYSFEGGIPYSNLPTKGFTDYDSPKTDGKLSLKTAYMASLEVGMKWVLNDNFNLYTGIYGDYGLNDIQKVKNKGTVTYNHEGTISPKVDPENQNFLAFNNSVTSTSAVQKIIPMTFGIKLRLSFGLGETKVGAKTKSISQQQREYYHAAAEVAYKDAEAARLDNVEEDYAPPGASMTETRPQITNQELKILLEPIWGFDITKTVLTPEMKRILDRKIPILKKYWYLGIVLQGHTCDIGSEQVNEKFGYERAQAVKEYFVKNGLTSTRFSTVSKGKHYPAVQNSSEEHRKRNRRVELSIKK